MSYPKQPNSVDSQSTAETLRQMISGYQGTQIVYVAARLNLADLLRDGPKSSDEVGRATGTHPQAILRLLRCLVSQGIFAYDDDGRFKLNHMGELLCSDHPHSVRPLAILVGESNYQAWGDLLYSIRTGKSAFEHRYNLGYFQYLDQNPELGDMFNKAMTSRVSREVKAVMDAYDFSSLGTIVDIGGGQGTLISSILKAYTHARGVLFDLPSVITGAKALIDKEGLASRCTLVEGNFFESIPEGGDAYILGGIIHNWNDEQAITILKKCRLAMSTETKLLLLEPLIPASNFQVSQTRGDLHMLVLFEGANRTEGEYSLLLERARFRHTRTIPTESWITVIEAVPE
jgi:hypothetical protein